MNHLLSLVLMLAIPASSAETPMSAEEFEALSTGHTLRFRSLGAPFGAEQYFEGRRTLWKPAGGPCQRGIWYSQGDLICFQYEDENGPACWSVTKGEGDMSARLWLEDGNLGVPIELSAIDDEPLDCPGPDLGV